MMVNWGLYPPNDFKKEEVYDHTTIIGYSYGQGRGGPRIIYTK